MAQHCRTEEFVKGLGRLTLLGLVPTEEESRLDAWMQGWRALPPSSREGLLRAGYGAEWAGTHFRRGGFRRPDARQWPASGRGAIFGTRGM